MMDILCSLSHSLLRDDEDSVDNESGWCGSENDFLCTKEDKKERISEKKEKRENDKSESLSSVP